jgi:hypothetical protein
MTGDGTNERGGQPPRTLFSLGREGSKRRRGGTDVADAEQPTEAASAPVPACASCSADLVDGAAFCGVCGAQVVAAELIDEDLALDEEVEAAELIDEDLALDDLDAMELVDEDFEIDEEVLATQAADTVLDDLETAEVSPVAADGETDTVDDTTGTVAAAAAGAAVAGAAARSRGRNRSRKKKKREKYTGAVPAVAAETGDDTHEQTESGLNVLAAARTKDVSKADEPVDDTDTNDDDHVDDAAAAAIAATAVTTVDEPDAAPEPELDEPALIEADASVATDADAETVDVETVETAEGDAETIDAETIGVTEADTETVDDESDTDRPKAGVAVLAAGAAGAATATAADRAERPTTETALSGAGGDKGEKKAPIGWIIGGIAAAILIVVGAFAVMSGGGDGGSTDDVAATDRSTTTTEARETTSTTAATTTSEAPTSTEAPATTPTEAPATAPPTTTGLVNLGPLPEVPKSPASLRVAGVTCPLGNDPCTITTGGTLTVTLVNDGGAAGTYSVQGPGLQGPNGALTGGNSVSITVRDTIGAHDRLATLTITGEGGLNQAVPVLVK